MPRLTPGSSKLPELADDEKYTLEVAEAIVEDRPDFNNPEKMVPTLRVTLVVPGGDADESVMAFLSVAFGKNKTTGKVSRFRAFCNAVAGKPEDAELMYFDTDTIEWGYTQETPDPTAVKLEVGQRVAVIGTNSVNEQGYPRYQIERFRPAVALAATAKAATTTDDIPF